MHTVFAEDLGSTLSNHVRWLSISYNSKLGCSDTSGWLLWVPALTCTYPPTHTYIHFKKLFLFLFLWYGVINPCLAHAKQALYHVSFIPKPIKVMKTWLFSFLTGMLALLLLFADTILKCKNSLKILSWLAFSPVFTILANFILWWFLISFHQVGRLLKTIFSKCK